MPLSPQQIKRRLLTNLTSVGLVFAVVFLTGFSFLLWERASAEFRRDVEHSRSFVELALTTRIESLSTLSGALRDDPAISRAVAADSAEPLEALFERLQQQRGLSGLELFDAELQPLAQLPAAARAPCTEQAVVRRAAASGQRRYGFEFCGGDEVRLTVALPLAGDGELLAVSSSLDRLLQRTAEITAVHHLLVGRREHLQAAGHGVVPGLPIGSGERLLLNGDIAAPESLAAVLHEGTPEGLRGRQFSAAEVRYVADLLPLSDDDGSAFGEIVLLRDITDEYNIVKTTIALLFGSVVVFGLLHIAYSRFITGRVERELAHTYSRLDQAQRDWLDSVDALSDPIFLHDREFCILRANRAYAEKAGLTFQELIGKPYWEVFPKSEGPLDSCVSALDDPGVEGVEQVMDGDSIYLSRSYSVTDDAGNYRHSVHVMEDITELHRITGRLAQETRARLVVSASNQALVRAASESDLLHDICRIATEVGGYKYAWVGIKEYNLARSLQPVAASGIDLEQLGAMNLSWAENPDGEGPANRSARTGEVQVARHVRSGEVGSWLADTAARFGCGALAALPLTQRGKTLGVLGLCSEDEEGFDAEELRLLTELSGDLAYGIIALRSGADRDTAERRWQEAMESLRTSLDKAVQAMAAALEARDPYTAGHQRRVANLGVAIGRELGLPDDQIEAIRIAGILHDIGKIYVPAEILSKPGRLTPIELDLVKSHAQVGYDILKDIDFPWPVADIVRQHHERLDGSGYPLGLHDEEILPEARILAVADVVEAMATHRPYRPGLPLETALGEIEKHRGEWFDPSVVDAVLRLFRNRGYRLDAA